MDSGNSASLQSSSGGDDDFDSRCGADSSSPLSALLRQPPPSSVQGFGGCGGGSLIYGLQELRTPPLSQSHWCSSTTAAPLPAGAEASVSPPSLPVHGAGMSAPAADEQADAAPVQAAAPAPPRGSRKRARASRRAPTTVLTTDTSNFRAMVQEFTGIPAPPFAGGGGATTRSRFDHLFPLRTATTAAGTGSAATLPQYLLRPFAQKLHASSTPYPPSFASPSTSAPALANVSIAPASTTGPGATAVASSSDSYHQFTAASPSALLGMQQDHGSNSYHSLHQSSSLADAKYAAHPAFDRGIAPPPPPSSATRLQDPAHFLGLTHDVMVASQGQHAHLHPRNGDELSGLVGGASVTGSGGCKATYSSTRPLLERSRRKPSADVSTSTTTAAAPVAGTAGMRTQAGVVDSWVCTSD